MTMRGSIVIGLSALAGLTGCIQDEALNSECDVLRCTALVDAAKANPEAVFFLPADTVNVVPAADSKIEYNVWANADLSRVCLRFKLTDGAVIYHESDTANIFDAERQKSTVFDFSEMGHEERFKTQSQDGHWSRWYSVSFRKQFGHQLDTEKFQLHYGFETCEVREDGRYEQWYERVPVAGAERQDFCWASGNPGYKLSHSNARLGAYPTCSIEQGKQGKALRLVTRDTGDFGRMASMPIAAGNMFLGNFDLTWAVKDAMQATVFGIPFFKYPQMFHGYYKYRSGDVYKNRKLETVSGPAKDGRDMPSLYAILYKNVNDDGSAFVLHGNDVLECLDAATGTGDWGPNGVKHGGKLHHVAIAAVGLSYKFGLSQRPDPIETVRPGEDFASVEWREFTEPFIPLHTLAPMNQNAFPEFNQQDLMDGKYNFTICFSASKEGAEFCGAVDSELWVDEVDVICMPGVDGLALRK